MPPPRAPASSLPLPARAALAVAALALAPRARAQQSPAPSADTAPPRLTHFVTAPYPAAALAAPSRASVLLELEITPEGRVASARVLESDDPRFDDAALAAARAFEFAPAVRDGAPVAARIHYRYRFTPPAPAPAQPLRPTPAASTAPSTAPSTPTPAARTPASRTARAPDADETGLTVRGERPRREVTRTTLERAEIVRAPGTLGDALRSLQNLPGLARAPFLSGSLIVRGSSPADTQVLVDGTSLPILYHFGALGSTIPTDMLDRVDFYPGNFSAAFGRATGGIVDVGLRSPAAQGPRSAVNLGLLDASAFTEARLTPTLTAAVGARFAWGGYLMSPIASLATGASVFIGYWDAQGILEWRPTPRDRVRLVFLGDSDTASVTAPDTSDAFGSTLGLGIHQGYQLAQLSYSHRFPMGAEVRAVLSGGWTGVSLRDEVMRRGMDQVTTTSLDAVPFHFRYELTAPLAHWAVLHFGVDAVMGPRDFQPENVHQIAQPAQHASVFEPGAYLEAELTPAPGLRVLPSLRFDYSRDSGEAYLSPRVSARWAFLRGWVAKAGVGQYVQPPITEQLTVPPEELIVANHVPTATHLLFERAVHASAGIEHDFSRYISVTVEGFYKSMDHALVGFPSVDLVLAGASSGLPSRVPVGSTGLGRVYGAEILLRHRLSDRFFGWVAYTLMRAERQDTPTSGWRPFEFDQTHNLVVLASYNLGAGWEVGARFRYVTGRPTTLQRVAYNADLGVYEPLPGVPYAARVPDFHQLDLRVEHRWRYPWGSFALYLEVLNVYNRANAEEFTYSADLSEMTPAGVYLPFFPNLGLRGEL